MVKKAISPIGQFIQGYYPDVSANKIAKQLGVSPSYLNAIFVGSKTPSIELCIRIANVIGCSRIKIFQVMGWLDDYSDKALPPFYSELMDTDPLLGRFVSAYAQLCTEKDRARAVRVLKVFADWD